MKSRHNSLSGNRHLALYHPPGSSRGLTRASCIAHRRELAEEFKPFVLYNEPKDQFICTGCRRSFDTVKGMKAHVEEQSEEHYAINKV